MARKSNYDKPEVQRFLVFSFRDHPDISHKERSRRMVKQLGISKPTADKYIKTFAAQHGTASGKAQAIDADIESEERRGTPPRSTLANHPDPDVSGRPAVPIYDSSNIPDDDTIHDQLKLLFLNEMAGAEYSKDRIAAGKALQRLTGVDSESYRKERANKGKKKVSMKDRAQLMDAILLGLDRDQLIEYVRKSGIQEIEELSDMEEQDEDEDYTPDE